MHTSALYEAASRFETSSPEPIGDFEYPTSPLMIRKSVDLSSTLEISIEDDRDGQQDKQAFLGKCKDESIELEDPLKQSPHRKFPLRSLRVKAKTDTNSPNVSMTIITIKITVRREILY